MRCQLCIAYEGHPKEIEDNDLEELGNHVKEHQSQTNELNEESWKTYSNWCFPDLHLEWDDSEISSTKETVDQNLIGMAFNGSIKDYCAHLLKNCTGTHVQCDICNIRLVIIQSKRPVRRPDYALNHAYTHLDQALFSCRHCDHSGKCRGSMLTHLRRIHRLPFVGKHYKDKSGSYRDKILAILDRCYAKKPNVHPKPSKSSSAKQIGQSKSTAVRPKPAHLKPAKQSGKPTITKSPLRGPVSRHCLKLLKTNANEGRIQCRPCKAIISVKNGNAGFYTRPAINHVARRHLKEKFFQCNLCPHGSPTLNSILAHIRIIHKERPRGNYLDRSKNYENELIEALSECFDGPMESDANALNATRQARLTINALCMKVLKENAQGMKIRCNLCGINICIRNHAERFGTRTAINHVQAMHMEFKLFRCKLCQHATKTMKSVIRHIGRKHKTSSVGHYTDHSDEYKHQIMATIMKCYEKDLDKYEHGMESWDDGSNKNTAMDEGLSTSGCVYAGFIQTDGPLMWKCSTCSFATKHAKSIKNHVANHK